MDLHSIMYLLIRRSFSFSASVLLHLHSIMYLLIRITLSVISVVILSFTFHNVSINSDFHQLANQIPDIFTFHNVSINSEDSLAKWQREMYLHSIMYLLIQ